MSGAKKILGGVFWSTFSSVINALYGFFSVPVLLMHYGRQQYGLIGLAFSVNVYLRLMDMGFSSGNVKFFSQWLVKHEYVNAAKLFRSSLVFYGSIGILNAIILSIVSFNSQALFHLTAEQAEILHKMFYVLMISAFFGWISSLLDQFLRANEIIGWEQRLIIFSRILQIVVLILTIKLNFSINLYFMLTTFSALIIIPFSVMRIKRLGYPVSFKPTYFHDVFKKVLPYSVNIFSFSIFQFSANYLRPLILSMRSDVVSVADYRILEGFANMILLLGTSFVGVILPMATRATTLGDKSVKDKIAYDGTKYISIFLAFVVFGFIIVSRDLLIVYVGEKYTYLVIWLNIWVCTLLATHNSALSTLVLSNNNIRPIVYISASSAISSLTIAWFLIPHFKVGGVVIGYLAYCLSQLTGYYSYYFYKVMKLDIKRIILKCFLLPVLSMSICSACVFLLVGVFNIRNHFIKILVTAVIYSIIGGIAIFKVVLNRYDKDFIKRLFSKAKPLAA